MSSKVSLRIIRVKCIDETGGWLAEKVGNDEIYLGGFALKQNGDSTVIPATSIYPHFDDGDVKVFNPPKVFYTFPAETNFPREFGVGLVLLEKDLGGIGDALTKMSAKIQDLVKAALPAAGGVLGIAINVALTPFLGYVLGTIIQAVNDDVFPPRIVNVRIPSSTFTWGGTNDSAERTIRFSGHNGTYELTYDWQFV